MDPVGTQKLNSPEVNIVFVTGLTVGNKRQGREQPEGIYAICPTLFLFILFSKDGLT